MKPRIFTTAGIALFLSLLVPAAVSAASMGTSHGHDLDQLWVQAQQRYDLAGNDAVLLLESSEVTLLPDGGVRTAVHRVVWIGTARGIREYADLRIPYNSATATLTVTTLRTWRGERWWPDASEVSPTAVVETLPFAVALADDYTDIRETMLLHDGVELPCIMETRYLIEERDRGTSGRDGGWIFPQRDPVLLSVFSITAPETQAVIYRNNHGAPEPVVDRSGGNASYEWRMESLRPLGIPRIAAPTVYAPHVSWSTWSDWKSAGSDLIAGFDKAAVTGAALQDSLDARLRHEPSPPAKARAVAALVNEWTRGIDYDARLWYFSPRPAERTWETAYGHDIDRAALAATLFRSAGLTAQPQWYAMDLFDTDLLAPGPDAFDYVGVWVSTRSGDFHALYDAHTGRLLEGSPSMHARTVWRPGSHAAEPYQAELFVAGLDSHFELLLTLQLSSDGALAGTGYLHADLALSPYTQMVGLENQSLEHVESIVGSVLPGCEVESINPEWFQPHRVSVGFTVTGKKIEPDERGRTVVTIGDPSGGLMTRLADDIHLHQAERTSPALVPAVLIQRIRLRLKTGDAAVTHLPEAVAIENGAGRFALTVSQEDGWVTVERLLALEGAALAGADWSALRALLLEETGTTNRTIVLE